MNIPLISTEIGFLIDWVFIIIIIIIVRIINY